MKRYTKSDIEKWRIGLQAFCDKNAIEGTGYCLCGYMSYCCYCKMNSDKFACVKAIVKLCREKKIHIDYSDDNYKRLIDKLGYREDENRKRKESAE